MATARPSRVRGSTPAAVDEETLQARDDWSKQELHELKQDQVIDPSVSTRWCGRRIHHRLRLWRQLRTLERMKRRLAAMRFRMRYLLELGRTGAGRSFGQWGKRTDPFRQGRLIIGIQFVVTDAVAIGSSLRKSFKKRDDISATRYGSSILCTCENVFRRFACSVLNVASCIRRWPTTFEPINSFVQ
jgi:hypothetical protein